MTSSTGSAQPTPSFPYYEVFKIFLTWLTGFSKQNLYQHTVAFCAALFQADICSLFVRIDDESGGKVVLAAGRLPDGGAMDPEILTEKNMNPNYRIGEVDGKYDGLTGQVATTGINLRIDSYNDLCGLASHIGKWDPVIWSGNPAGFGCLLAVAVKPSEENRVIGILKLERVAGSRPFSEEELAALASVATIFAPHLNEVIMSGASLSPGREHEYRVARDKPSEFESKPVNEVSIQHVATSICQSDIYYFKHMKDSTKLDERLPLVLGHETVGEIVSTGPDARDIKGNRLLTGDRVFVIPLLHCGSCRVCAGKYGENYCASSRFMASTAPGSLRTSYRYNPQLTIKVGTGIEAHVAVFAEPLANIVQLLNELGIANNAINLNMGPFDAETFTYFRFGSQQFTSIFNTVIDQLPLPRTLVALSSPDPLRDPVVRSVSLQGIMRKGIGLVGQQSASDCVRTRCRKDPRVLIMGTSVSAYLLAAALKHVCGIKQDRIAVTGRTQAKLDQFKDLASVRVNIKDHSLGQTEDLLVRTFGVPEEYDIAFECIGGEATQNHIDIACRVLKHEGILAMFGMTDEPIRIDFSSILRKQLFIKGSYRASLEAYVHALDHISAHELIRSALENLIDDTTIVAGSCSKIRPISDAAHLSEMFEAASRYREKLGRIIVGRIGS